MKKEDMNENALMYLNIGQQVCSVSVKAERHPQSSDDVTK